MENGRISQKLSIRPKLSERKPVPQQASKSPKQSPAPESPKVKEGIVRGLFGERSLLFLGVIASILALSMALWSIHKNSDNTRRLNSINSSLVDLLVKQKAAPVVEVARRDVSSEGGSRFEAFKEKREAKKQERPPPNIVNNTVQEIQSHNQEKEREHTLLLERIKRESEDNIRKMELASQEAIAEGSRHRLSTKQLSDRISRMQVRQPISEDIPYSEGVEKMFEGITQMGDKLLKKTTGKKYSEDIDIEDLEKDLRLLAHR